MDEAPCRIVFITLVILSMQNSVVGRAIVPCFFIFGDSLVDSGNNNNLQTLAKVNYSPYGIDFPEGYTGRFTNGQTTADIIAKRLGFKHFIPPYATANGSKILYGVNYASGSAGIRDESGIEQGDNINLSKQLANHRKIVSRISHMLRSKKSAVEHLKKCLYSFVIGSNDYINNYFVPQFYITSRIYTPEQYAKVLARQFLNQIKKLYKLGARKIHISGVGQIGCTPYSISYFGTNNGSLCVDKLNVAAVLFNKQLKLAVKRLNEKFKNAKFIFDDPTNAPAPTGLDFSGCCEVRKDGLCIPGKPTTCQDRNKSIFFDSIHPTEVVYKTSANRTLNSLDPSYLYPINLLQLARLQIKTKAKKNLLKSGTKILL